MDTRVSSAQKEVIIGNGRPTVLIGERINPSGKKKLSESLRKGDMERVRQEALAQVKAGADILDVNVGVTGLDQTTMLPQVVQIVQDTVDVPLCIDSDIPAALEAALKVYKGKALVNSVSGEEKSMAAVLPLVKEHKAAVVAFIADDKGISMSIDKRLAIAHRIVEKAESMGIPRDDIVIDCATYPIVHSGEAAIAVLDTLQRIKSELGVNVTMGASIISFGMPDRDLITNCFVAAAVVAGATSLIVDVAKVRQIVLAAELVMNRDKYGKRYVKAFHARQPSQPKRI
jgi:5-methyltetrahydrofolate--homocysteine methyltransferase